MKNKKDVFKEVLKEELSNSMTTTPKPFSILWRPNNYRRQIKVKTKSNSTIEKVKSAIKPLLPMELNYNEHTKIISIKKYLPNITIQYGKDNLTAIYSQNIIGGVKEIYLLRGTLEEIEEKIQKKKQEIKQKLDDALLKFSRQFKISIPLVKASWSRYEDFIKGEDYIDNIPAEVIIHDTYFKKVYEKGIEFTSTPKKEEPTVHFKTYIKNRALEDIAPEIAKSMGSLSATIEKLVTELVPTIQDLNVNTKSHVSLIKGINSSFKKFNNLLEQKSLNKWL